MQQAILDLFETRPTFSNFISIKNEMLYANLQSFCNQFTHINGASKTGKTHLLKAWINLVLNDGKSAIYIDCTNQFSEEDITRINLNLTRFIAIDNIDLASEMMQEQLFNLYNKIKLHNLNNYLLTSSTEALNQISLREDLLTRLLSGIVLQLKTLSDAELIEALTIYIQKEGINFDNDELNYLITHYERNMGKLIQLIDQIAKYAIIQKKKISTTLIKLATNIA